MLRPDDIEQNVFELESNNIIISSYSVVLYIFIKILIYYSKFSIHMIYPANREFMNK